MQMSKPQNQHLPPSFDASGLINTDDITHTDEGQETLTQNQHNIISQPMVMSNLSFRKSTYKYR